MNIVKQKRIEKSISMEEMAKYFSMSVKLYEFYENNYEDIPGDMYVVLSIVLDFTI